MPATAQLQPRCIGLSELGDTAAGGKAEGLAKLITMGLPVPSGFVIIDAREKDYPADLDNFHQSLGDGPLAVRSSAYGEDGQDASFAGQYESVLNVEGRDALRAAIDHCVASLDNDRSSAYRDGVDTPGMCVVVQRMVDANSAGVLFTADPVSGRRDRLVIDAVWGLGEALVSGEATPDHYELDRSNSTTASELVGDSSVLSDKQLRQLAEAARRASYSEGQELDLEWAIDHSGELYWLQARPITTLPADLNELDTAIPADHVLTRCNVGEMMPGAVCPLTFSVAARGIEHGMQHMHVSWGARPAITPEWTQIRMAFGHLFIDMTGSCDAARVVGISSAAAGSQSLCGRPVPELKDPPLAPIWRRWWGNLQFARYCLKAASVTSEFESRFRHMRVRFFDDVEAMIEEMEQQFHWICETNEVHLRTSGYSGVMEGIIQSMVSGGGGEPPTPEQQAELARLLAGAENVESAVLVEQLDEVVDAIALSPGAKEFQSGTPAEALAWLQGPNAGAAGLRFRDFMRVHGHRSYRELCVREKAWVDEPEKLIVTMQASLASRLDGSYRPRTVERVDYRQLSLPLRWFLPLAHGAVRQREQTKSLLVEVTHRLKRGYRHLGHLLARDGLLADPDLVFFLTREELSHFCRKPESAMAQQAIERRQAFDYQSRLSFDDIYVGQPEPVQMGTSGDGDALQGRPVSRGVVEGVARVALTLEQAAELQPGEILIAPITDVGWTPYFSLIAGLATDVGSAVSHGAVIAREYGLPAIVNLREATRFFKTGERVRLDADSGVLSRISGD